MEYKIHEVEWTDEKVSRFWDFQNKYQPFEETWFTKQAGRGIINFTKKYIDLKGVILDYGTGKGHLIKPLLEIDSAFIYGFDFSPESIQTVNDKYKNEKKYKGCKLISGNVNYTQYDSESFDVILLVEVIEHLTDKYLKSTIEEIKRILKKNGVVVITTPNNENLPLQHVLCPDCGALYHRVQHVRSFNKEKMEALLDEYHFKKTFCGATNFVHYNDSSIKNVFKRTIGKFINQGNAQIHLAYIGTK